MINIQDLAMVIHTLTRLEKHNVALEFCFLFLYRCIIRLKIPNFLCDASQSE